MPWRPPSSTLSANSNGAGGGPYGAYHIQSTRPIVAYQFNPLEERVPTVPDCPSVPMNGAPSGCFSYSTDASLLLPTHALFAATYAVTGYHAWHEDSLPFSVA